MASTLWLPISAVVMVSLLAGCSKESEEFGHTPTDRGTRVAQQANAGINRLPKGVNVDDAGRWSLASAPPSEDSEVPAQPLAVPAGALFLFHQTPPSSAEAKAASERMIVVNLVRPPRYQGRIILDRGCLRIDSKERPAIRFSAPVSAAVDQQGYLIVRPSAVSGSPVRSPRVGEPVEWPNQYALEAEANVLRPVTDAAATAPIIARCGAGPVVEVPFSVQSSSVMLAEDRSDAKRLLRSSYGLSEEEAEAWMKNCAGADCFPSPPPPVPGRTDCPQGSTMQSAVCRTPEGYIRPIPHAPSN